MIISVDGLTIELREGKSRDCESESSVSDPDDPDDLSARGNGGVDTDSFGNGGTK